MSNPVDLPKDTQGHRTFQDTPWTYYYSNVSHERKGTKLLIRRWCTYYNAKDERVGSYAYPDATCAYNPTMQHEFKEGEVREYSDCYRFESV
jgi:hypothetical protein